MKRIVHDGFPILFSSYRHAHRLEGTSQNTAKSLQQEVAAGVLGGQHSHLTFMNSFTRWKPAHASASTYQSSDFQTRHAATSRAETQKGDKSGSWVTSAAGNQTGALGSGKGRREEEETVPTLPLEACSSHPSSLDSTLQHIVQQLDILTQTVSVLEERLTLTEDRMKECLLRQSRILRNVRASRESRRSGSDSPSDRSTCVSRLSERSTV